MVSPIMLVNPHSTEESEALPFQAPQPIPQPLANVTDTIEQVRELLYGDAMRHHGRRMEDMSGVMRDLEQRVMRRLDEMQNAIDALARSLRVEQTNAVRGIGLTLAEMGRQIAATGDVRGGSDANP